MLKLSETSFGTYAKARRADGLPVILDLGCGTNKVHGAFGVDIVPVPAVDLVHDLQVRPYPLPENSADAIYLTHVLEHLANPMSVLEEVWRIARPNGQVIIRTPHYSGIFAWRDPTHRRSFSAESFHYFGENNYSLLHERALSRCARAAEVPYGGGVLAVAHPRLGSCPAGLFDRHPTFCERFLAYLVGGVDEIQATLSAVKPQEGSGGA